MSWMVLPLLGQDWDNICGYSWGLAVLLWLYRQLCDACMRSEQDTNLGGCAYLQQIWIWERIAVGRPHRGPVKVHTKLLSFIHVDFNSIIFIIHSCLIFWYFFACMDSTVFSTHIWICVEDNDSGMWSSGEEVQVLHKWVGLSYSGTGKNPCQPACSFSNLWFIKYSLSIHYLCRWSAHHTVATFLTTSSSQPCVSKTDFCGGEWCHSSYTMFLRGICQTGCYASLGGYNRRLQRLYPLFQHCTSKNSTRCNFHYS
jgi:hypothetical protein